MKRRGVILAGVLTVAGACDSGNGRDLPDPGPASGLDSNATLISLDTASQTMLCEWIAGRLGGYGHRATCSNGQYIASLPLQQCVDGLQMYTATCPATVGTIESCVNDAVDGCPSFPPDCLSLMACVAATPASTAFLLYSR